MWQCKYECNLRKESFSKIENEKRKKKQSYLDIFIFPLAPQRIFSGCLWGLLCPEEFRL